MSDAFEGWCVLELMGHRKLGGFVAEQTVAGAAFIRIDVPGDEGVLATQLYSPSAVYCITPTTEALARALAKSCRPQPVTRWELPAEVTAAPRSDPAFFESDDGEGDAP